MNKPRELTEFGLPAVTEDQRYIGTSEPRHGARRLVQG
jgi:carbon-monoxide dehydrogenase large subunit